MIKVINYFFQSIIIYIFFIFGKLVGLKLSRKIFSFIFLKLAPTFKSKKVIEKNLNIFKNNISVFERKKIVSNMWKNYGMTFIEYIFLNYFRSNQSHIKIKGEENLNNIIQNNKPVIFISGHFANFELMSMEITKKKFL